MTKVYCIMDVDGICMSNHHYYIFDDRDVAEEVCEGMSGDHSYVDDMYISSEDDGTYSD